jgi:transposase
MYNTVMNGIAIYSTFDIRLRAVEAVNRGIPKGQVATAYGIDRTTLYRWIENFHQGGVDGLYRKEGSGRPKLLDELSETELRNIVLTSALSYGFESDLWTVGRLHRVITESYLVSVSKHTIWRRLVAAGLTYQKPEREYYEADESVRKKWRRYEIPKIRRCIAENKAILYFQDESNVSLTAFLGKTWSPCGQTPKATVTGLRGGISAMSAISNRGSLVFRLYEKRIASLEVIGFLNQMLFHHPRRHLVVVMDQATPHTSKMTRNFIESQKRLHVFYLPPYSPTWNPDEKVWNHLKCQELKSHQAKSKEELKKLTNKKLRTMSKNPRLLRGIYCRCCVADFLQ